jgi:hypothetical protein
VCQRTLDGDDLDALRTEYDRLVNGALPAAAACAGDWPIRHDHCFARVVLDTVFAGVWYDHVDGRPAVDHLSTAELRRAVDTASRMLREGRPTVARLNDRSLRRRGESG